jgi:photosystem II stability/assembly factor-like uncharacterized protein
MEKRMPKSRFVVTQCLFWILLALGTAGPMAAGADSANAMDPSLFSALKFRLLGPMRGGRVTAVTGIPGKPLTFFMGTTGGGVWKTQDGGLSWANISDGFFREASIGSVEAAPSDPNVIFVGTGSASPRGNISTGRGVYKSTDGGKTWIKSGLDFFCQIGKLQIHPQNPELVYAAVLGNVFGPDKNRGVYRSRDGGRTWDNVLFVNDRTGCIDMVMDPANPRIIYAGFWQAERKPWTMVDGGPDGGVWKTTDGGDTWARLKGGLPEGRVGRVGVAVSPVNPDRLWIIQEAEEEKKGGIYMSTDAGKTFSRVNRDHDFRQRAWYYTRIFAHPTQEQTLFVLNTGMYKSLNGGQDFTRIRTPHGDNHCLWINPLNPSIMIESNDGGSCVTFNGGKTWTTQMNQPTSEIYRLAVDSRFPYRVYGDQQDNSTISLSSQGSPGQEFYSVGGGESGHIAVDPRDPDIVYAGNYIGILTRLDRKSNHRKMINAYPELADGIAGRDLKYRFQWNFPIRISPHDPDVLYITSNHVHRSRDQGQTWEVISPDLTNNIDAYLGRPGGPIQHDTTGVETYCTIFAFEESPSEPGVLWAGSDDGRVHVSRDAGKNWTDVTPGNMPAEGTVNMFDISPHGAGRVFMTVYRYRDNDFRPYIFLTENYGRTWKLLTDGKNGIPADHFVRAVKEHPERRGLLFAGTEFGLFISFDQGKHWQPFQQNLPVCPITDLMIHQGDLLVSTQGRAFWILDDLSLLAQIDAGDAARPSVLYTPENPYRTQERGPISRLSVYYRLKEIPENVKLEILDAQGNTLRSFPKLKHAEGLNRFSWDLTLEAPKKIPSSVISLSYTGGPRAVPGDYAVRLTAGEEQISRAFCVQKDPRWKDITLDDLREQHRLQMEAGRLFEESHNLIKSLRSARAQVKDISARASEAGYGGDIKEAAERLAETIGRVEENLIQTKNESGQDAINYEVKLDNQLAYLYSFIHSQDSRPAASAYSRLEELKARLAETRSGYEDLIASGIPGFIRLLEEKGVPRIIIGGEKK